MSSQKVFIPPGMPQPAYQQPTYAQAPIPAPVSYQPPNVECGYCGKVIRDGEDAIEIFFGMLGRSNRSGNRMVVHNPKFDGTGDVNPILHVECAAEYIQEELYGGDFTFICDSCGSRKDNDEYEDDRIERRGR